MTLDPTLYARLKRYLPDDMLDQLPDPQAMTAAIRRMNSLHQAVSSFLPQYVAENQQFYVEDYGALRPGTFLFADVSGFTALSELLQREAGRDGPNILTDIINDFFAKMLEILAKSNGQLLKFAGDAMLTFFPAVSGEDESPLAVRTGLRMQREMVARFQPIQHPQLTEAFGEHHLELSMSIGICQGSLFEAVAGNTIQRDHIIQGDLPGQAMAAEAAGDRDDVIITAELRTKHAALFETKPMGEGFFRVIDNFGDQLSDFEFVIPRRRRAQTSALFDFEQKNLLEDLTRQLDRLDGMSRFVTRDVVDRLAFKGDRIEAENRQATVIFTYFSGFADLLDAWGADQLPLITSLINRYYNLMQRIIANNGGALNRSDPYQRGAKLLITFGAPVAHVDDPERAVATALEMNRQLASFNQRLREELPDDLSKGFDTFISQRIGITHGPVFAGEAGWKSRREYTVMGDEVNLAARLMSKGAKGQILVSARVWERVNPHFDTEALPPMQLKGKSQPVQAYLVKASTLSPVQRSPTSDTPFVGRDLQMLSLTYALQQAKGPRRAQSFALVGDAGMGKTRMIKQVVGQAEQTGFRVAWANCQLSHSQDQSVWAAMVFQLLQLDQAKSERGQRRLLHVRLNEMDLSNLETMLSLLIFGSYQPPEENEPATKSASSAVVLPPTPAVESRSPVPDIYQLAQVKTDLTKSGIYGIARDQLQAALDAAANPTSPQPSFYQSVQKQISQSDSIVRFLQVFTEQTPALLVMDDAHRADAATRAILKQVLTEITRAPFVVLVAYEPEDGLDFSIRRKVTVSHLDESETAELAMRVLKVSDLGPELRRLLWERTNGRPLFIESLVRLLQQMDRITIHGERADLSGDANSEPLPENVRELILSEIDRLSPEARDLLQAAAVLGDGFTTQTVIALAEGTNAIRLEALLGELIFRQIIESLPDNTYRFRHGLAQATVYDTLNRLQRQKLHRAAAEALRAQDATDRSVLRVAYHMVKGGVPLRGIELVSSAADQAEKAGQIDRALELYTHALEIFPHDDSLNAQLERLRMKRL